MDLLILFGPPGVGKGTQAEIIARNLKYHHLSTGELFRKEVANKSKLGKKIGLIIKEGKLVPDSMVTQVVEVYLKKRIDEHGFILDGFPRTLKQAKSFDKFLKKLKVKSMRVINLTAHEEELVNRLIKRGKEQGRKDDREETIKLRLEIYSKETLPVLKFYKKRNIVLSIDGVGDIKKINSAIITALKLKR